MTQVGQCAANETDTATAPNMPKIAAINKVFIIIIILFGASGLKMILMNNTVPLIGPLPAIDIFRTHWSR